MTERTRHPYRVALESRDGAALQEVLHPDVTFYSPGFVEPVKGRDNVMILFAALGDIFEDPQVVDELEGDGTRAIAFRMTVDGHPLEGVDHLQLDDSGRVVRITVSMRPLPSLQILSDRIRETIAEIHAAQAI